MALYVYNTGPISWPTAHERDGCVGVAQTT
jgi:hypothetical protein